MSFIKTNVLKNKYFKMAHREMQKSIHPTRFGAVLVLKNGKVFRSHNKDSKTHPYLKKHYPFYAVSIHAELSVLLSVNSYRYGYETKNSTMYIYREDKQNTIKPARPCPYCMDIIKDAGVKKLIYTDWNGYKTEYIN